MDESTQVERRVRGRMRVRVRARVRVGDNGRVHPLSPSMYSGLLTFSEKGDKDTELSEPNVTKLRSVIIVSMG